MEKVKYILLLVLSAIYMLPVTIEDVSYVNGSAWYNCLICQFFHANIIHLACNVYALWLLKFTLGDFIAAYIISIVSVSLSTVPVVGASSFIYALAAFRMSGARLGKYEWMAFFVLNAVTIFIPSISFIVHISSFSLGYLLYKLKMIEHGYRSYCKRKQE